MSEPDSSHRRRKQERPQELLDAALELFAEKGFAATRIDEIAHRAGVSKGTLYLYFTSKQHLLQAVIAQHLSERIDEGAALAAGFRGGSADLLRDLLTRWWSQLYDSPASGVFKLIVTEVRNFPEIAEYYHREVIERAQALLGGVIRDGIGRGEFRDVDVNAAVQSLVLPLVMLCLHKHSLGACDPCPFEIDGHRFIRQHVRLVLDGLRSAHDIHTPNPDNRR